MKTVAIFFTLFLITSIGNAQSSSLTVIFKLKDAHGALFIRLLDENGNVLKSVTQQVKHLNESITFNTVELDKNYAVECFQDMNNNKELDTSFFGMPEEAYGFSNNVRGNITGKPDIEDQYIHITKPTTITINVE